ncbi:hypothetical protein SH668x_001208 [Planctomicrobium sp. SH668]|uniref:hypothetical protein n=1 Tax=Planctomicrobium sp. SH668 TaxID=3448126 RepID=UPI003F5B1359
MGAVIGLDPSMSGFAICRLEIGEAPELKTVSQGAEGLTWESRLERYGKLATKVAEAVRETSLPIFIEAYSFGSKNTRAHTAGEFGCYLRLKISQAFKVRLIEVTPNELKKFVTGKGNAGKSEMVSAVSIRTGIQIKDDNQSDAYGLAWIGQCVLGLQEPTNKIRAGIVEAIRDRHGMQALKAVTP